ncbi:Bug family tripartite tricarboxylate transporter substrate binding protein [Bradyrhizobium archetypum]|uniref:Tripartite tricarboxylate transporter substrate binding protein n=1 Tax=Bradyrhizobium archetypum TaxID=2721160 RepID=A0A7Y4H5Q2_9BRAD|nr:tripartite tricarboxylate transporter substrate binding protein [Bradyrhizobium archetypum]NOJ47217.1 tripartite tricarboxylate transporter substrate binding protein [Bradyrhizobium archetypum]
MHLRRREFLRLTLAAMAAPVLPGIATAQIYPSRSVRLLVGFPAGGPVDIAGRLVAPWLSQRFGQPFVVDNQPGESGNAATRSVVRAEPDGHTLLICGPVNTINTTLFEAIDFSFERDITPVAGLYRVPLVIEVHPSVPVRTVSEFIAYAKANPGKIKVGFAGQGTPQHIAIELFKTMAGIDLTLIPYLGSAPALADLLNGSIQAMFDPMPSSIAHIKAGTLIPLAVTTPTRSANLPDVAVAADTVPRYEAGSWFGMGAPRGTPEVIVEKLNQEINEALKDAGIKTRLAELGAIPMPGPPAQFEKFIAQETEKYAEIIRSASITAR